MQKGLQDSSVQRVWNHALPVLVTTGIKLTGYIDLRPTNRQLLLQRGVLNQLPSSYLDNAKE